MIDILMTWLRRLSHLLGFETADSFPPGHPYEHTRWDGASFDIASDVKPEQIEQRLCDAIANTPLVFGRIVNPTPRMQRTLLAVLEERMRVNRGRATELAALLVEAYDSPHITEVIPGLRTVIANTRGYDIGDRARAVMAFLGSTQSPFDVIEMN
ncbi:hypothetical protein GJ699_01945 [Duganella sp. FT80W]|uniref:Uncharacterized protein n=1 Tax=Duganella guangzhouensis TaxID=2666084 RepID=A0A6I2KSQ5_9BURK|nr:hypothetical protein [Duganella guangzhouensis]MRW88743.1 hypothetical protein [Duganella guangzhouensis]